MNKWWSIDHDQTILLSPYVHACIIMYYFLMLLYNDRSFDRDRYIPNNKFLELFWMFRYSLTEHIISIWWWSPSFRFLFLKISSLHRELTYLNIHIKQNWIFLNGHASFLFFTYSITSLFWFWIWRMNINFWTFNNVP